MTLIEKLSTKPAPPVWAKTLRKFHIVPLAEHLGVSPGWLGLVLTGGRVPGKKLEEKILALLEQIEAEQR